MKTTYIGVGAAAKALGLSTARVKVLAKDGRIGQMVAGRYLFTPQELEKFAEKPRVSGPPKKSGK